MGVWEVELVSPVSFLLFGIVTCFKTLQKRSLIFGQRHPLFKKSGNPVAGCL